MKNYKYCHGLTLLELAIVLVIIGLLAGGVVIGADMRESAAMNRIMTDLQGYSAAANTFQQQYGQLPGDFSQATNLWANTYNGDGNGEVASPVQEALLFWQHLQLAELIKGGYNGINTTWAATLGLNIPESALENAGYGADGYYEGEQASFTPGSRSGTYFTIGAPCGGGSVYSACGAFTPLFAKAIDTKLNDGLPQSGLVRVYQWPLNGLGSCHSGYTDYNLANTSQDCGLVIFP